MRVRYTEAARLTLIAIYNFVDHKFGRKSADKFQLKANKTVNLIAQQPLMFKASEFDEHVRVGFITKQCSLFYHVTDSEIILLYFWDNRQEPLFFSDGNNNES